MADFDFDQLKVLYVDSNERAHQIVRTILNAMHIKKLTMLSDSSDILGELDRVIPDILITEYKTEPIHGLELIRQVRQDQESPDPNLPIIVLTAHTAREVVMGARNAGANYTLAKPVSITQVYSALCWLVEKPVPFVCAPGYYGPDRRRKMRPFGGEERRSGDALGADAPDSAAQDIMPIDVPGPDSANVPA